MSAIEHGIEEHEDYDDSNNLSEKLDQPRPQADEIDGVDETSNHAPGDRKSQNSQLKHLISAFDQHRAARERRDRVPSDGTAARTGRLVSKPGLPRHPRHKTRSVDGPPPAFQDRIAAFNKTSSLSTSLHQETPPSSAVATVSMLGVISASNSQDSFEGVPSRQSSQDEDEIKVAVHDRYEDMVGPASPPGSSSRHRRQSSNPTISAPASRAASALAPWANTATRTVLPVTLGSTVEPLTT